MSALPDLVTGIPAWCPVPRQSVPKRARTRPASRLQRGRALLNQLNDEFLGCALERCKPGAFAMFCELALGSDNLDDLFCRGIRFYNLISDNIEMQYHMTQASREFVVRIDHPNARHAPLFAELWLAAWYRLCNWVTGRRIPLEAVNLSHPAPPDAHELPDYFGCLPRFDTAVNSLRFSAGYASLVPVQGRLTLDEALSDRRCALLDLPEPDTTYSALVYHRLVGSHGGWPHSMPAFDSVARALCITPQTLRRKLGDEGTNFKRIKDDLRRSFVKEKLLHTQHSVEEIAELAGFSETSSLIRAFKRWTGVTPAQFRKSSG